jgi:hypothetical protein
LRDLGREEFEGECWLAKPFGFGQHAFDMHLGGYEPSPRMEKSYNVRNTGWRILNVKQNAMALLRATPRNERPALGWSSLKGDPSLNRKPYWNGLGVMKENLQLLGYPVLASAQQMSS